MNLFGMGPMEILVIAVVALIIFGPGRLPEIGAQAGKAVRDFRKATTDLTAEFQGPLNEVQATVGEMKNTVRDVQRETQALAKSVADPLTASIARPSQPSASVSSEGVPAEDSSVVPSISTAEPVVPEVAATRADPFADLAALEDDDAIAEPANSRN